MCGEKIWWFFSGILYGVCRTACVGHGWSGSCISGSAGCFPNIRSYMLLGIQISRIGVVRLEECLDVLDFLISGIKEISVGCRSVDEVI